MTSPNEIAPITFQLSRELTPKELTRLARVAGTMGLAPIDPLIPLTKEEILAEHITHTYPQSAEDFIGKEHLWVLGEEAGIDMRKITGTLFMELCFPVTRNVRKGRWDNHDPIERETLGLVVRARKDVDLPPSPVNTSFVARQVSTHIPERSEAKRAVDEAAIQIKGVAALDNGHRDLNRIFTPGSRLALRVLTPRLREFS